MSGILLTPAAWMIDLDGDGEDENGKETVTKTTTRYKLEDGVYLKQP